MKIGITGHRTLLNYGEVTRNIRLSLRYFSANNEDMTGVTALASGADTIFAKEILLSGLPLQVILPFPVEEYKKDLQGDQQIKDFDSILKAKNVTVTVNSPTIPREKDERDEAYLATGKRIVDETDILLAVWDGEAVRGKGGTEDIIAYARQLSKDVYIIKGERNTDPDEQEEHQLFIELDEKAIKYKKRRFEPILFTGLATGVAAVMCFAVVTSFLRGEGAHHHWATLALAICEVVFVFTSFILLSSFANKWKRRFLDKRRETEYLRILIWFKDAQMPVFPIVHSEKPEEFSDDLRKILVIEERIAAARNTVGDLLNAKRLLWCLADEQGVYHKEKRVDRFKTLNDRLHLLFKAIKFLFLLAVVAKFGVEIMEYYKVISTEHWMVWALLPTCMCLVIVLPSFYAMLEGLKYFGDWKRTIKNSEDTISKLADSQKRILEADSEAALIAEAKILRNIVNLENIDWVAQYIELEIEAKV